MEVPSAISPQRQPLMVLPPSVAPASATGPTGFWIGTRDRVLVAAVSCVRLAWLPTTKILPFRSPPTLVTNFDGFTVAGHASGSATVTSTPFDAVTASAMPVRHAEAARTISETFARTV